MDDHKAQSKQGPLSVHFSIASVAHNLYAQPIVKFYDPVNDEVEYNERLNQALRSQYYTTLLEAIEHLQLGDPGSENDNYYSFILSPIGKQPIRLLLHRAIVQRDWASNDWLPDKDSPSDVGDEAYIDADGVGLMFADS